MAKTSNSIWVFIVGFFLISIIYSFISPSDNDEDQNYEYAGPNFYDDFSGSPEMHWTHMPLTYGWNEECSLWLQGRYAPKITQALQEITNITDSAVTFQRVYSDEPDIMFICNSSLYYAKISGYRQTLAEAQPYYYAETNTFTNSRIYIYDPNECRDRPATLIHEILHLFGVEHALELQENLYDIMLPTKYDCNAYISNATIDYLKGIYKQ